MEKKRGLIVSRCETCNPDIGCPISKLLTASTQSVDPSEPIEKTAASIGFKVNGNKLTPPGPCRGEVTISRPLFP